MKKHHSAAAAALALTLTLSLPAAAQERVTLKSAASSSSYYVMIVQIGEALKAASDGKIQPTVEESQGSVQNVKEAGKRPGNFVFTSPPNLLADARSGKKPFEGESGYDRIRTLFVMPPITVHFVVRADSGITDIAQLEGKDFIGGGKGTFCEGRTRAILKALDLEGKVNTVDVELASADNAVRNRKVVGYATCSSHPTPGVTELATHTPLRILSFTPQQLETVLSLDPASGPVTIAGDTYKGMDGDVQTVGVPVGGFTTTAMDDETAYQITKIFWSKRDEMAGKNPWWKAIAPDQVNLLGTAVHPGALRYYKEAGVTIGEALQ
ncbi:TAXI family TRAP transporter solute-binding subunit [Azospirillum halopraeferens]|uniref:TAXI family TRAP transporter solute-binding subunit n=1 Tax=Azospirillum halopraeferens TaxID=34010 RepID=UPI000421A8B7|nr:TAXI family TRAP transporter solute-binding subunit [Azospirillum halopraeferens]